ncbi:MAG: hypothetical protein ACYSQY_12750 [Planctomycetota bacterium]|jgi:hypothetical protein
MKILTLFLIALMIFAASPVFACGDSSGEDKDDQSFTIDVQYLCGTCGCTKKAESKPEEDADSDEEEEAEDKEEADDQCGGDKDGDKDEEPEAMCSGSGCGRDKDETEA